MNKASSVKDHRQIGKELDLFSFSQYSPGAVFWHPKGWKIYKTLENFIREKLPTQGYEEISTPIMVKSSLFKKSGHWEHFGKHNMYNLTIDNQSWSLKPMNCPEASLIFASKTRSYQDLPIRFSEFDILYRRELSGVIGGLFRMRQFVIDDAHLFVRPDQIQDEIHKLLLLVVSFYKSLGFTPEFYLSTKPDKAMGDAKFWEEAEKDLKIALEDARVKFGIKEKDGAFYGPKIDIHIKDSQDRDWQLATIQLDFQIPERLKLEYIDRDGKPKRPVIVHRAILGSVERFIGILTEHYQGAFPLWLSPVQVVLATISEKHERQALSIASKLKKEEIRVELDNRRETLPSKIRDATLQKVNFMGIIGDKEIEKENVISVRTREGKDLGQLEVSKFLQKLQEEIDKKI
ncbi:MAG: threonine--tRNA ligase [Candidatus Levybacteria bacterium RIFCSPLOWO2_01_FULL_38_21]|nr:MAG: threonine--tRNA ligase [Candidatus Levybacteria bacterium RIFCSPLOWO2_01_FULL_38_21]